DEPSRGHCTMDEAIGMARASRARQVLLTHYASARRGELLAAASAAMAGAGTDPTETPAAASNVRISIAVPGIEFEISAAREAAREATATAREAAAASEAASPSWTRLPDPSAISG